MQELDLVGVTKGRVKRGKAGRLSHPGTNSISSQARRRGNMCVPVLLLSACAGLPFRIPPITSSQFQIGIITSAAIILLLALIARLRRHAMLKDYEDIAEEVRGISKAFKGKLYRKAGQLRLRGQYHQWPVHISFSRTLNTPGLHIRIPVPTTLTLFLVPRKLQSKGRGRVLVQTPDPMFDSRFATRSDQPGEIRLLVSSTSVQQQLQRLCCSPSTCVAMSSGLLEMIEPLIPEADLYRHVVNHVKSMAKVGVAVLEVTEAEHRLITPRKTTSHRLVWTATSIAIVLLVGLFFVHRAIQPLTFRASIVPEGILPHDAAQIPNVDHWRLARPEDFDPEGVAWLQSKGKQPVGHIFGSLRGEGFPEESTYVLISDDGRQPAVVRIAVFVDQTVRFDRNYASIAIVATVRKPEVADVRWKGTLPVMPPDGDGVLIVPKYEDPGSASIIFVSGRQVLTSGTPVDFRTLSIQ